MAPIDYDASISTVLDEIGSPAGSLASGAATALTLSLAVECLELALALSAGRDERSDTAEYREALSLRLAGWRSSTRLAFVDDPSHFGVVIKARRRRDAAPEPEKRAHVEQELEALTNATGVLIELVQVSLRMEEDARVMLQLGGASLAAGEVATAQSLVLAAIDALLAMTESNIITVHKRIRRYELERSWLDPLRGFANRLPEGAVRAKITSALDAPMSDGP